MTPPDPTEPTGPDEAERRGTARFVVAPARIAAPARSAAWTALGVLTAVVVIGLAAWGLASQAGSETALLRSAAPQSVAPQSVAPRAEDVATRAPFPALLTIDVANDDAALDALATAAGWGGCPVWRAFDVGAVIHPLEVEAAIRARGAARQMIGVADSRGDTRQVWLGGDIAEAARGFGGTFLVRDPDAAWTVAYWRGSQAAIRLRPTARRDGGVYWQVTGLAGPAPYCTGGGVAGHGPVRVVHTDRDPLDVLFEEAGWGPCQAWTRGSAQTLPTATAIEHAAAAALVTPSANGWVDVAATKRPTRVWLGRDEAAAAAAHGSDLMVIGSGDPTPAWVRGTFDDRPMAVELLRVTTPDGWQAWVPTTNAAGVTPVPGSPRAECGRS